jgi:hypothetical protein
VQNSSGACLTAIICELAQVKFLEPFSASTVQPGDSRDRPDLPWRTSPERYVRPHGRAYTFENVLKTLTLTLSFDTNVKIEKYDLSQISAQARMRVGGSFHNS